MTVSKKKQDFFNKVKPKNFSKDQTVTLKLHYPASHSYYSTHTNISDLSTTLLRSLVDVCATNKHKNQQIHQLCLYRISVGSTLSN